MKSLVLNETPVRTSKNFNINNVKLDEIDIPTLSSFSNVKISGESDTLKVEQVKKFGIDFTYGVGNVVDDQNQYYHIQMDDKESRMLRLEFDFDKENSALAENIEVLANEGAKATLMIAYRSDKDKSYFHQGALKITAKKNAKLHIIIVNLLNVSSNHFMSIENILEENACVDYTIVDFGAKNCISNLYSNVLGNSASSSINTIYLGSEEQFFDINYIAELRGENTNINMEVQGALADSAKKHFKGTIDFKKGSKKAVGNENESCLLLSDSAKSIALPMLLCSEEDVEGNHASSSGKIDTKSLFYIMSRGFSEKDAIKLVVKARFETILQTIEDWQLKEEILNRVDEELV